MEDYALPTFLVQRGFHAITSFARTTLGRQSGGLGCIYNIHSHVLSNFFGNDKFIISSISKMNLIIIFVFFNLARM